VPEILFENNSLEALMKVPGVPHLSKKELNILGLYSHKNSVSSNNSSSGKLHKSVKRSKNRGSAGMNNKRQTAPDKQ
jgi:hypothetical protein